MLNLKIHWNRGFLPLWAKFGVEIDFLSHANSPLWLRVYGGPRMFQVWSYLQFLTMQGRHSALMKTKIWYREHTIGSVSHHAIFPSDQLRGMGLGMGAHIFQNSQICGLWPWSGDTVQPSGWNLVGKSTTQLRCSLWSVKSTTQLRCSLWSVKSTTQLRCSLWSVKSTTQLRCSLWSVKGSVYPTSFAMTSLVVVVAISCYRQHCAQRKAPVYQLLRGRFWGFSSCRGDTLHWWGWNFAGRRSTPPCQISPPLVRR